MKRFWIVLLSLGLVMASGVTAFALVADMGGQVYFRGWYVNNVTMQDPDDRTAVGGGSAAGNSGLKTAPYAKGKGSAAAIDQRIRLSNVFNVEDGLSFTTRMDWIEDTWQDKNSPQETVAVDVARIDFKTAIGTFKIGPQVNIMSYGTKFQNSSGARPAMQWSLPVGPVSIGAGWQIETTGSNYGAPWGATAQQDVDTDLYYVRANYKTKPIEAGIQYLLARDAKGRKEIAADPTGGFLKTYHDVNPYFIANLGPLYLEGEFYYVFAGKQQYDSPNGTTKQDADIRAYGAYINAKVNMGPAFLGVSYVRVPGDDPGTADKIEGTVAKALGGGTTRMGSIMYSGTNDYQQVFGSYIVPSDPANIFDHAVDNIHVITVYGGYQITPKVDVSALLNFLQVDKTPVGTPALPAYVSDDMGKELDVTANFKIYDHLTYSVDAAYLWVGDFWKGRNSNNLVGNNYMLRHTLNLEF